MLVYQTVIVLLPCWLLNNLEFGGFEDTSSTLFVKVGPKGSPGGNATGFGDSSDGLWDKVLVLPIVLSMTVLVALLCLLLYHTPYRRRALKRSLESSLSVSGAPMNFSYRDLQSRTGNFSQLLGTGQHVHIHIVWKGWNCLNKASWTWSIWINVVFSFFQEGLGVYTREAFQMGHWLQWRSLTRFCLMGRRNS